jgi:hypothetical protein
MTAADAIPKLNAYTKSLKETSKLYSENSKIVSPAKKPLKQITNPSSPWKNVSAVGMAIILSPDPFSDVIGVPLFLIGAGLSKHRSPANMADIYKQHQKTFRAIKELKEGLRLGTLHLH